MHATFAHPTVCVNHGLASVTARGARVAWKAGVLPTFVGTTKAWSATHLRVCTQAGKGFGNVENTPAQKPTAKDAVKSRRKNSAELGDMAKAVRPRNLGEEWNEVARITDFEEGKDCKPIILSTGRAIVLYRYDGQVYCSDATSTAYKFPLANAKLLQRDGGPAVEVPLDGTVYDLRTGNVLEWCPKNNPIRSLLGALKSKADPQPLPVFPVVEKDGVVYVNFT